MLITSNNCLHDLNFMKMYRNGEKSREKIALGGGGELEILNFDPQKHYFFLKTSPSHLVHGNLDPKTHQKNVPKPDFTISTHTLTF